MRSLKRHLRCVRYRTSSWIKGIFTRSNAIFVTFVITLVFVVLVLQRLEDPSLITFSASGPFASIGKRRELIVTTAKITAPTRSPNKCEELEVEIAKLQKAYMDGGWKLGSVSSKRGSIRYLPAIRTFHPSQPKQKFVNNNTLLPKGLRRSSTHKTLGKTQPANHRQSAKAEYIVLNQDIIKNVQIHDQWLTVSEEDKNKVLMFSAYWDDRNENPYIRIMAIMVTKNSPTIYCRVKIGNGKCYDAKAIKKTNNEHWRLKYSSYFVSCPVDKGQIPPSHITLSIDADFDKSVTIPIHFNKNDTTSPRGNIAVCVKPLHYNYNRATWLLEFLEIHRMLGVDHFFFYNHTTGPNVDQVLRTYINNDVVTVLPWEIGIKSQKEIRTEAIFSSLNDCLFRTMFLFNFVIMLDFDEYIIPREHDTYLDMIKHILKENKVVRGRAGSFIFRNTFFYLYWPNDTTVFNVQPEKPPDFIPYFVTQYKTRRLSTSMKPGSRSKYIVIPERAIEVGNHVVWKHTSGSRAINVPERTALLHHYRICEFGGFACLKKKSVLDPTALRFGPELLERVQYQCELVFKNGGKCPISPPLGSPW